MGDLPLSLEGLLVNPPFRMEGYMGKSENGEDKKVR